MPYTGGTFAYTNPSGATGATAGSVIQSATWNQNYSDIQSGLTQAYSQLLGTQSAQKNVLFGNGGFEIWQRNSGTTSSIAINASTTAYTADRWYITTGANQACIVSAQTGLTNGSNLCAKVIRNSGDTGVTALTFGYPLDTDSLVPMRGKPLAVSFTVKTGANWSGGTLTYTCAVGTGSVAKRGAGFTNETVALTGTVTLAVSSGNTAVSLVGTVAVPTTTTQGEFQFTWTPSGTAGADDSIYFDDVQLEVVQSTPWTVSTYDRVPYMVSLIDCYRHFQKTFPYATAPAQTGGYPGALAAISAAAASVGVYWRYATEMRATPTVTTYSPAGATANFYDTTAAASLSVTATATSTVGQLLYSAAAAAANHPIYIQAQADAGI